MELPLCHCHHRQFTIIAAVTMLALLLLAPVSAAAFSSNPSQSQQYMSVGRRLLGGPGSSPPTCRSKCGRCVPCKPVLVPIHPDFSMKMDQYYPLAWRCKCRDKIFKP